MLFRIYAWLRYWLLAMDKHALQSPFLFQLYTQVLKRTASVTAENHDLLKIRKRLVKSSQLINQTGHGAESTVLKKRRLGSIVRHGTTSSQNSALLSRLAAFIDARNMLELGTSVGLNAAALAISNDQAQLLSIDSNTELIDIAKSITKELEIENLSLNCSTVDQFFIEMKDGIPFDFVFMDANHTYEATLKYYIECQKHLSDRAVVVLDDINWSAGMRKAWEEILSASQDRLCIENFQFGMVFSPAYNVSGHYILSF